jgi:hypothetical protein
VNVALDAARHDLRVMVVTRSELDQARDRQRLVLHQAEHPIASVSSGRAAVWTARGAAVKA